MQRMLRIAQLFSPHRSHDMVFRVNGVYVVICGLWLAIAASPALVAAARMAQRSSVAAAERKLTVGYPAVSSVAGKRSFDCVSLMDMDITGSPKKYLTNGIEGKVTRGQNGVSVSIKDASTLSFLSSSSALFGAVRGDDFSIVKNDDTELVAYLFNGTSMNSFVLNKTNGLAIWSKIRSTFPLYGAPTGDLSYMLCK